MTLRHVILDDYLQDTMQAVDPTHAMPLRQQHCKSMMRTLLGLSSIELDQKLRDLKVESQWIAAESFIERHGEALAAMVSTDDAPQLSQILGDRERFRERPGLLFSTLSRGRVFQGNFERLLQAVQPEWMEEYEDVFRELPEKDLLRLFVEKETYERDEDTRQSLLACLDVDYATKPSQPSDGGQSSGKRGEADLFSYLESTLKNDPSLQILAPVWIIRQSHKPVSKRCKYALELPSNFDLHGMTSELDAMVILTNDEDHTVKLVQVWEAKATLSPPSLQDALVKKGRIIQAIAENESSLLVRGRRYRVGRGQPPRLGIFGGEILSPGGGAGKSQTVVAEQALQRDPSVVREALERGYVSARREQVVALIENLRKRAQTLDPIVVVSE